MREGTAEQATLVRKAIQKGGIEDITAIQEAVRDCGALVYTSALARSHIDEALRLLQVLPPSVYRDSLEQLAEFAIDRSF
jgi:octaprenyl-diphosphate synthase